MKFGWNMVFQVAATLVQGATAFAGILPPKQQASVAVIVAAFQGIIAALAHFANPDGTPARVPYQKE